MPNQLINKLSDHCIDLFRNSCAGFIWLMLALFFLFLQSNPADPDLFARMAVGREIESLGYVPIIDPFAFTPKKTIWIDHEWLSGLVFYGLYKFGGEQALLLFKWFMASLSLAFIYRGQQLYSITKKGSVTWAAICLAFSFYIWSTTVRSQVFTYLFIPVTLWCFARTEREGRTAQLIILPLLMIVWANAHGGFVVGLGFQLLYIVSAICTQRYKLARTLTIVFALSILTTFINPYGAFAYWEFVLHAVTMPRPFITEWAAVSPFSLDGIIALVILGVIIQGGLLSRRLPTVLAASLLASSLIYGFKHNRLIAIFAIVAAVFGINELLTVQTWLRQKAKEFLQMLDRARMLFAVLVLPLFLSSLINVVFRPHSILLDTSGYPVAALDWLLNNGTGGKLLVDFNYGSYALWRGYPKYLVSLDGRYEEVYPDETLKLVYNALHVGHPEHYSALEEVDPDYILITGPGREYSQPERFGPSWQVAFKDENFLVLQQATKAAHSQTHHNGVKSP